MDLVGLYNSITGKNVTVKDRLFDEVRMTMKHIREAETLHEAADHVLLTFGGDETAATDFARVARTRMRVHV